MFFKSKPCSSCTTLKNEIADLKVKLIRVEDEIRRLSDIIEKHKILTESPEGPKMNELIYQDQNHIDGEAEGKKAASVCSYENTESTPREELSSHTADPFEGIAKKSSTKFSEVKAQTKTAKSEADREKLPTKQAVLKARLENDEEEARAEALQKIKLACYEHFSALSLNLKHSVKYDEQNYIIEDGRIHECYRFLKSAGINFDPLPLPEAISVVLTTIDQLTSQRRCGEFSAIDYPEDSWAFEHWVTKALQQFGWQARVTQGSEDQGVDIVAIMDGLSIGIHCKRYSGSVGKKVVKKVFSGSKSMSLDKAAVLTVTEFTRRAKDLAASTGVLLLSTEDIPTLHEKI